MFFKKKQLKTKDILSTSHKNRTLQDALIQLHNQTDDNMWGIQGLHDALKEYRKESQSKNDKTLNEIRRVESKLDKALNSQPAPKPDKLDDQIDRLENLVKFLLDNEGYYLYEVNESYEQSLYELMFPQRTTFDRWEDEPICRQIEVDDLQKLGKYTTITISEKKYVLSKKKLNNK
jgi:hypothetical protein